MNNGKYSMFSLLFYSYPDTFFIHHHRRLHLFDLISLQKNERDVKREKTVTVTFLSDIVCAVVCLLLLSHLLLRISPVLFRIGDKERVLKTKRRRSRDSEKGMRARFMDENEVIVSRRRTTTMFGLHFFAG
ncbi:hypothetical protein CAEBREN_31245 [Caenorhabditis brenneri]|uniref:Transmembrane protein n=1 Tax=Caenorhabditis brenneri TaxID=135651 RepID=G0NLF8_CAEBE|nr:hypothetical protein CAEBREN_31245 [Caenorhabditis brenneri]